MKNSEQKSKAVSLVLLIPALILGIVSAVLAYIGLGMITLLPALTGVILGLVSLRISNKSFRAFSYTIVIICAISAVVSVFRGVILGTKVANDTEFDSTLVKTQKGIDKDIQDAFGDLTGDSVKSN